MTGHIGINGFGRTARALVRMLGRGQLDIEAGPSLDVVIAACRGNAHARRRVAPSLIPRRNPAVADRIETPR